MNKIELKFLQKAIENELYLEGRFNLLIDNSKVKISKELPRFQARLNAYNLYGNLYLFFDYFIDLFFYILTLFLFIYEFLKLLILKTFSKKKKIDCKHLFFINSPVSAGLAKKFITAEKINLIECSFFALNSDHIKYLDKNYKYFYLNEIISYRSIFVCFYLSIKAFLLFNSHSKKYNFFYFSWLIQLETLKILNYKHFHSFDHYDRYAILADSQMYFKKDCSVEYFFHQHGKFNTIASDFSLPNRINNISHLVLFDDDDSLDYLLSNVIEGESIINNVYILDNCFMTINDFNEKRFKILVIGNLACYQLHKKFIKSLETDTNLVLYYKPHPSNLVFMNQTKNCINIKDIQYYPHVDVVVSYDSTLLDEYLKLGYFCIKHSLDELNEIKLIESLNKFRNEINN